MPHNHKPLYRFVLRDALDITWRNKFLWFFGFFVALLGNGGAYEVIIRGLDRSVIKVLVQGGRIPSVFTVMNTIKEFALASPSILPIIKFIIIAVSVALLFIVYLFLASTSVSAIVVATRRFLNKEQTTLGKALREGMPHWPHVFSINLLTKILVGALVGGSAMPLGWLLVRNKAIFGIMYVPTFVVLLAAGLLISFLSTYAACSSVLGKRHVLAAIVDSWKVFARNVVVSIEMALLLFFINLVVSIFLVAMFLSIGGFLGFFLTVFAASGWVVLFWIFLLLTVLILLAMLVFVGSFLGAFQLVSWTILYTKILRGGLVSKVVRLASSVPRLVEHIK